THNDEKKSLSLAEDQGRVLIKCFAGCETKSIVDKLGITWQDLFDKKIKQPSSTSLGQSDTRHGLVDDTGYSPLSRRIHQVYKYVDESGKVLYENVRYYPKSFRQRGYNEKGESTWNLEGVRRVPYRLPELIRAKENNADVFLCEGEKDADALRELVF